MGYYAKTPFYDIFEICETVCEGACLSQGDIIKNVKDVADLLLVRPDKNKILGYLIISNSCDLENKSKLKKISLVPIIPFADLLDEILAETIKKIHKKKAKEEGEGRTTTDTKNELETRVADTIFNEANYKHKFTFFISPLDEFDKSPAIAVLNDVRSIEVESIDILLKNRIISLKAPWREKLGHKVGYIFNRVSTETPDVNEIKTWWIKAYEAKYSESLPKI